MRILHTADWHLGKTLEGRSRLPEQEAVIDEIVEIVQKENIDVVLLAGDAFDTVNPPADAEKLFYESLSRLSDHGKRHVVVIAGNHDHPGRLSAAAPIAAKHAITLLGFPTDVVQRLYVPKTSETLIVAALPYPSESRLNELLSDECDETLLRARYDERIRAIFAKMNASFQEDAVNIAMSHLYVAGGATCDSERPIELGGAYTVSPASFPQRAQYVALGHLHRPQDVKHAVMPARYSGSPLAYSFSEAGYSKSVTIVDVQPRCAPVISECWLSKGRPLVKWKATEGLAQVYRWIEEGRDRGAWIDLEIDVEQSLTLEETHRLRKCYDGFVHIRPNYLKKDDVVREVRTDVPIETLFTRFYERQTGGGKPSEELVQLFLQLVAEEDER
ncbi:exonuclease SbcCD subunit D C-terminal domain-containing protein [Anoxybacillus salavatliensis]|uniref:exonuclease SbcCD subunit D n=1 Tax=Anoxybacillus TaxID=150247 RepID=UPI0002BE1EFF|nr:MULTISPECIES: exonuclease SbcCD subunit D [Anoxybacillus]EMI10247.1 DNA repair exonuclease SbcD [Anoxybacillus gonensis]MCQ5363957.1 exonuclease SbcCD subunit D C-terminal domain-containing protein [Anoxybacillus gonensis]MCX8047693.1 exonuclease SbcCD subunit D C-terminal domain-containing protein [Anoxybacillus gonensis]